MNRYFIPKPEDKKDYIIFDPSIGVSSWKIKAKFLRPDSLSIDVGCYNEIFNKEQLAYFLECFDHFDKEEVERVTLTENSSQIVSNYKRVPGIFINELGEEYYKIGKNLKKVSDYTLSKHFLKYNKYFSKSLLGEITFLPKQLRLNDEDIYNIKYITKTLMDFLDNPEKYKIPD